jgi:hypothetical protein
MNQFNDRIEKIATELSSIYTGNLLYAAGANAFTIIDYTTVMKTETNYTNHYGNDTIGALPLTDTIQAGSEYEEDGYGRRTIAKVTKEDHLSHNDTIQLDVKSSLLKMDNFIFNEDSGSEMCHKTTREFMQKLRAVVKF